MSRVDAFGQMGNDNGRIASVGGRGASDSVWTKLNTDNAGGSDCALRSSVEVVGERSAGGAVRKTCRGCGRRWADDWGGERTCPDCGIDHQGIDTRKSYFRVGLPDQARDHCEVEITVGSPALRDLVGIGSMLCGIKGAQ